MWNKFEASSSEEETLGNSYFTNGLFKISNEDQSTKNPQVSAVLQNNKILIAVDKSLIFLEDESTIGCNFLSFSSEINCFSASRSGDVVVCCLADGNIHGVHIKGVPVFNLMIKDDDVSSERSFLGINQINDEFNIMCSNGAVYKLHKIDESQLADLTSAGDESSNFNETLIKTAAVDKISNVKLSREISSFCSVQTYENEVFIASSADSIFFITGDHVERVIYPENVKRIKKIVNLENFIVGLTETGSFVEICPFTRTVHAITSESGSEIIEDLRVLEANEEYIELLVLSSVDSSKQRAMKVLDFPTMTCKSELTLPGISWLVSQQKSAANMYFISGSENDQHFVQTIEISSITETDPEQRFKKLLLRGLFDEAEAFAKDCDLSLEPLHEARVKKSLMKIQSLSSKSSFEKAFQQLMQQLTLVEDKNFLVTLRLTEIPDRTSMTIFLEYLLANIDTNQHQQETNEVNELLLRLETLRLIDPDECNMQWMKFLYHPDIVRLAMDYFKSDVLLSCLIWSRHSSSIIPKLNLEQFYKWLGSIPTTMEPFQLIQWLKHFSPCFLQTYPQEMKFLVDWSLERTRNLQFSNAWPEIGLEFINNINGIFRDVKFMFIDIRRLYHNNMEKIQQMIFTLEEMSVLKKTYHLTMTLDDYSKGSIEDTALRLLQRIQMHNLRRMVNDFLYPIFMEHGGTPEETIVKYIQFLCSNKNLGFWQERAVVAIDLLSNEENRLSSALLVLKVSPVPWSDVVIPLAKLGTTSSHPLAHSIYIEYKTQAIKIIKVKYQWPVDYFDLQQDRMKLVFRILKIDKPEMIDDIKTVMNSSPDITQEAYYHLMFRLIELGRIDELMTLAVSIESDLDSHQILFEKVINGLIRMIDQQEIEETDEIESAIEAVKLLIDRLRSSWDLHQFEYQQERMKTLKNIVRLRSDFHLQVELKNLDSKTEQERLLLEGISMIAVEARQKSAVDFVWSKIDLLVATFQSNRVRACHILCQKLDNLFVTCHIVDALTSSVENFDQKEVIHVLHLSVMMIHQQMSYFENNLSATFEHYDPLTFPLAFEFLTKCRIHLDILNHSSIIKLLSWVAIARDYYPQDVIEISRKERIISSKTFASKTTNSHEKHLNGNSRRESFSIFDTIDTKSEVKQQKQTDENLNPVLRCVCNSLKVLALVLDDNCQLFKRLKLHLQASGEQNQQQHKDDFFSNLENLMKLKQLKPAVKIMQLILEQQKASNVVIIPPLFATSVNKKILKFMLSQKDPEYLEAFRILRSEINRDDCMDYLRSTLKNNSQKIAFSTFSEMYNNYIGNVGSVNDERQNRLKFYYYSELCKYDQSIRFKSNFDNLSISELLTDLENRQLNVELVKKLSKDFGWDYQKALIQQIKILLRSQEMEFDVKTDVFGKEEVVVKSSVDSIKNNCFPYLNEITNLPQLAAELQSFIKEINYYFYEMYLVVLDLIEYSKDLSLDLKIYRNVLLLLKHKLTGKRRSIEQEEADQWMRLQSDNTVLPGISKYRLPFKPMMESLPETYLNEELNVDTFEKCIPLITLHASLCKMNADERLEICAFQAVKNSVMELKAKNEATNRNEWNLKPTNNAFLQTILRMTSLVKDKSKRLAILFFHVNHSPPGCDQVEAAYECWKFVLAHEQGLPKYFDLIERIKRKYPLLKTQHLLHVYGVADEKLLQLVENPTELINALYHHDSIIQPQKKDINKLCEELAQLYNLDLLTLQNKLLHKWLAFIGNSSFEEGDVNETVYEDFIGSPVQNQPDFASDDNVFRAHYILSSWKSVEAMDFLACELNSSSGNAENQLQLYECFAKLIDDQSGSYMDLINPNNYLLVKCCHYLKGLGINLKQEKFKTMDKVEILKKVWTSHYNNSKGLEVMSFICLGFDVHLPQIWNGILKQMIALKMASHLSILVEALSTKSKLLHLSHLKAAWECVMMEPFLNATKLRSYEQEANLAKALILLQKCPISTFLDFQNLIEISLRLDRPHMAAVFIAFANERGREKFVKLLESYDKREMKKDILELEEMGIAPVVTKSAMNILKL